MLTLLFPDLALIALGYGLSRKVDWGKDLWPGIERLNYYVLFPALLFHSLVSRPLDLGLARDVTVVVCVTMAAGLVVGLLARPVLKPSPVRFASSLQCAYRFNSYLALALSQRIAGDQGLAICAVCIGVAVPIGNVLAVTTLARHTRGRLWREVATNPLILATVGGLVFAAIGWRLPSPVDNLVGRCGAAALAVGLLTVGAALRPGQASGDPGLAIWITAAKLIACPAVAAAMTWLLALDATTSAVLITFSAVPTASASYVLASRMGGDGPYVAWCVTLSTLASIGTMLLWLARYVP